MLTTLDEPEPNDDSSDNNDFLNSLSSKMDEAIAARAEANERAWYGTQAKSVGVMYSAILAETKDVELTRDLVKMIVGANLTRGMLPFN